MALKQCGNCGNTFWCEPDAKLCVICRVMEKHRQVVEREKAAAKEKLPVVGAAIS
jgi:hypothetical protein